MSKYQREFLIPYLEDAYALHIALHKLQERLAVLERRKNSLERGPRFVEVPVTPQYEAANGIFLIGLGLFTFFSSFVMSSFKLNIFVWFCLLFAIMAAVVGVMRYVKVTRENANKESRYNEKLLAYRQFQGKNSGKKSELSMIVNEIQQCQCEIERAQAALQTVYAAKIIPGNYRNIDAVRFLHAWFCTGNGSDLGTALQVYSLVGANAAINQTVTSNTESILRQYLQFSTEEPSPEAHIALMQRRINQPGISEEERNAYHAMLEGKTAATAYFAGADYLSRIST